MFLSNEQQTSIPLSIEALDPGFTFNENVSLIDGDFFMTLGRVLMTLTKSNTLITMMIFMSVSVTDDDDDDDDDDDKEYND